MTETYEAVALVEIASIARGFVALDALMKRAQVSVKAARAVTPGKYIILFGGDVASVGESLAAAREVAGSDLIDELHLPYAHRALLPALDGEIVPEPGESVGIVEMSTVAATVQAADVALKATDVAMLRVHLAIGVGGKGWFTMAGELASVEASLDAVRDVVRTDRVVAIELIPRPHKEARGWFS